MANRTRTITETFDVFEDGKLVTKTETREQRIIDGPHCQSCGSTDYEDTHGGEGYSGCCNEIVVWDCTPDHCYH